MKINYLFKAILVCAFFAVAVMPPELRAEATPKEKQLATKKSQALFEKLNAIENKYGAELKSADSDKPNQMFAKYGRILKKMANEMYEAISQSDAPEEVRNAALEYAQAISNLGITCGSAPYIPEDGGEAFLYGFLRGMGGDITGGAYEITEFQRRFKEAIAEIERKEEKLKVVAIKYGVK